MGRVTCGMHGERKHPVCCWRCDRYPKCDGVKIGRGDYCADCRAELVARGYVWNRYFGNYVTREEHEAQQLREAGLQQAGLFEGRA